MRVGRDEGADLVLMHPTVSRRHATLIQDGDRNLFLVARETQYGTTVDGIAAAPGAPTKLRDGSLIRFALSSRVYRAVLAAADDADKAALRASDVPVAFGSRQETRRAEERAAQASKRPAAEYEATRRKRAAPRTCLLYTSDAADE